jgi:hypothetical protein
MAVSLENTNLLSFRYELHYLELRNKWYVLLYFFHIYKNRRYKYTRVTQFCRHICAYPIWPRLPVIKDDEKFLRSLIYRSSVTYLLKQKKDLLKVQQLQCLVFENNNKKN